jgi:tetratricopeptide (TPR) repeat protein
MQLWEQMDDINPDFIERYQRMYETDPNSRIFAPLSEAYRKMGLMKEARELAESGVRLHPDFAGGRVALGRIYHDLGMLNEAAAELKTASELSPENILAHQILAECFLKLKRPKDALKAYKMLLFLSPDNDKAIKAVKRLESLTADEYEDEVFSMKPLKEAVKTWADLDLDFDGEPAKTKQADVPKQRFLDRVLSLSDAYIVRNDIDRALETLQEAERLLGPDPEIVKRLRLLHNRQLDQITHSRPQATVAPSVPARDQVVYEEKIEFLQDLLARIKSKATI